MQEAGGLLVGEHDFRNLCKVDPTNAVHFVRKILDFQIEPVNGNEDNPEKIYYFRITGHAFLWHQIRCIVEILFLVGKKLESPDIVSHLLDINACPRKPSYEMAPDLPLCLWDCSYPDLHFTYFPGTPPSLFSPLLFFPPPFPSPFLLPSSFLIFPPPSLFSSPLFPSLFLSPLFFLSFYPPFPLSFRSSFPTLLAPFPSLFLPLSSSLLFSVSSFPPSPLSSLSFPLPMHYNDHPCSVDTSPLPNYIISL